MILVTGASGFLGHHLVAALAMGNEPVKALYHSGKPSVEDKQVSWQQCDLLDVFAVADAMKGVHKVYHCAAQVSFDRGQRQQLIRNNVTATAHVVNEALEAGVTKLVHVSSVAALGRSNVQEGRSDLQINEETQWEEHPHNSAYAESKYWSEMEVWRAMAEGLNAVIVNPPVMLGSGDFDKGSAHLMQVVANEFPWYTGGTNAWVDVRDVVKAMMLLMRSGHADERFIVSAGNYSYREVFTLMAEALNCKPPHKHAGKAMTGLVWRLEAVKSWFTRKPATVNRETARIAQLACYYDNKKLLSAFPDFRFRPLETTVSEMALAFKEIKSLS